MHPVQIPRRQLRQFRGQPRGGAIGHIDKAVGEGQPLHLIGNRFGHVAAAQADIGAPHAADGIKVAAAFDIPQPAALAPIHHQRALVFERAKVRPGVQMVRPVHVTQGIGGVEREIGSHRGASSGCGFI